MPDAPIDQSFPPTAWTVVFAAQGAATASMEAARDALCTAYRQPVLSYLLALGLSAADAEDKAQDLLSSICRDEVLAQLDPAKGRLRHFLKAAARHLVFNHRRDGATQKRGQGSAHVSLDEAPEAALPATDASAEHAFDRQWAWTLFQRTMTALEESYALRGKGALLAALKPALTSVDEVQPYAEIGSAFGVGEAQIRNEIHRLRRRFAERLRTAVASTLDPGASAEVIEEETRYLVRTLAHEPRD